jgi:acylphosphatase
MEAFKEIDAIVHGKVQMVMFRDFVKKKAYPLNITGFVENRPDGTVHVVAQGREENLERLIEHLHKGPFTARVSRVDVHWRDPKEDYRVFSVVF